MNNPIQNIDLITSKLQAQKVLNFLNLFFYLKYLLYLDSLIQNRSISKA